VVASPAAAAAAVLQGTQMTPLQSHDKTPHQQDQQQQQLQQQHQQRQQLLLHA
jgi:hypothetical protein